MRKKWTRTKFKGKEDKTSKETKIPLVLTYKRCLPDISKVVRKH